MASELDISKHYSRGELLDRLRERLREDDVDPDRPSIDALAPYDHFHGRGLEATEELAAQLGLYAGSHVLDVGCGIGGPARFIAHRYGCRVTGVDLTAEFCDVARLLSSALGLEGLVSFEQSNALSMPFADCSFDAAYSMNVSMNIEDKQALYREIYRVARPGARLILSELAQGPNLDLIFPTPWARTASSSFLATPSETLESLEASGFAQVEMRETKEQALAYNARARAMIDRGEKPPQRAVHLIHGALAAEATANTTRGLVDGCVVPIEVSCCKPSG
ncbi:MAG: class I SAM-dependent methyltransferase [Gammaproteobacteria bacterium]